jgi:hypothetical protein
MEGHVKFMNPTLLCVRHLARREQVSASVVVNGTSLCSACLFECDQNGTEFVPKLGDFSKWYSKDEVRG